MGEACGTYRKEEKCIQVFGGKMKERDPLEDLVVMEKMEWV